MWLRTPSVFPTPCTHLEQSWGPQPPQTPTGEKLRGGIFRETSVIATHMKRAQSLQVRGRGARRKMKNSAGPKLTMPPRPVTCTASNIQCCRASVVSCPFFSWELCKNLTLSSSSLQMFTSWEAAAILLTRS